MLSFPKGGLKGSAADIVKYVENERDEKRQTGYYSAGGAPSEWGGEIARELGLSGKVGSKDFLALLEGRLPDGTVFAETSPDRRMGKDLTSNAPKSCSIAMVSGDERLRKILIDGHERANRRMMQFVEKEFVTARYKKGGAVVERTGSAVWASHRHEDARTAGEPTAYMHLHTHNVLLNVTRGRNGQLRALDIDFGVDGVHLAGAVYQAEYAAYLRSQGVDLRRTENGWELACITDEQIVECSPRSAQIEAELARQGLDRTTATATQKSAANKATRGAKTQLSQQDQRWEWRSVCRRIGVDLTRAYKRVAGAGREDAGQVQEPNHEAVSAADALKYSTDHLSERESVINSQSAQLHALRHGYLDGVTLDLLNDEIAHAESNGDIHDVGDHRLVTRETLEREASILAIVSAGRDTLPSMTDESGALSRIELREAIERTVHPEFSYTDGQRDSVMRALTTPDQYYGVKGSAGAGKSAALAALSDEAHARGFRVIGTGPSQTSVDGTKDANPDDARVLASFNAREDKDQGPRLILMDEAGMVSARDMESFLQKVRPQDRVVFVGDPLQLSAVEAGSPFAQMMKDGVISYSEITEIQRQKDAGLLAVAQAFADGRNADAVALADPYMRAVTVTDADYEAANAVPEPVKTETIDAQATPEMLAYVQSIIEKDNEGDAGTLTPPTSDDFKTVREWLDVNSAKELGYEALTKDGKEKLAPPAVRKQAIARETAAAYLALSQEQRDHALVLSGTNETRRAINKYIRSGLQESGIVSSDSVTVTALDKVSLTKAQLRHAVHYKPDMVLRVTEGRGRARTTTDWTITATDPTKNVVTCKDAHGTERVFHPKQLDHKSSGLYTSRLMETAVGDRVVFTENRRTDGYQNNETGTVVGTKDGHVEIRKDGGETVSLDMTQSHALDHGWAITVHRSQGRTIDRAIVAGEASRAATAESAYVACSREKWHLQIITDNIKRLKTAWAKVAERETAKDATERAAQAREVQPLEAARVEVRAEVAEQMEKAQQEREAIEQESEGKPEPEPVREREREHERELGDSFGW